MMYSQEVSNCSLAAHNPILSSLGSSLAVTQPVIFRGRSSSIMMVGEFFFHSDVPPRNPKRFQVGGGWMIHPVSGIPCGRRSKYAYWASHFLDEICMDESITG